MPITNIVLVYALLAGIMSILLTLFTVFIEKNKKKAHAYLVWATLFLGASFGATEYAFWIEGYNFFDFVLRFNFPLVAFFAIWFGFLIWLFESRGERKTWIKLLIVLASLIVFAMNCMDCIKF
jgi:hypothetical protein